MSGIIEVKIFSQFDNQSCVTTFNYLAGGTPASVSDSFAIISAMGFVTGDLPAVGDIYGSWKSLVDTGVLFTEVQAKAVYSATDFYVLPLVSNNAGLQNGVGGSAFDAYAMQTNRVRSDIRRGNKRLVGVTSDVIEEYGVVSAAQLAVLQSLAADLSAILTYDDSGNALSFSPIVVKKEKYETTPGKYAYRYYADPAEQLLNVASGIAWTAKGTITTQVSRKRGRGI